VFGIIQILFGSFLGFLTARDYITWFLIPAIKKIPPIPNISYQLDGIVIFALAAILFIILGLGSIKAKNWARIMSIAVFGFIFLGGAMGGLYTYLTDGRVSSEVLLQLFTMVILPVVFILFYGSPAVKATCKIRLPQ
jgi:RsiW-degrading membrane proteinase PrsW (M82 family)